MKSAYLYLALFAISSCGPVYQTQEKFIAPKTYKERMCANRCVLNKDSCITDCQKTAAMVDITSKVVDKAACALENNCNGDSGKSNMQNCESRCNESYRQCYQNCGGQIIQERICVYGCQEE